MSEHTVKVNMLVCIYVPTVHMTRVLLVIKTLGQISSFVIFTTNFMVNSLKSKKKRISKSEFRFRKRTILEC